MDIITIDLPEGKSVFFASDTHLGSGGGHLHTRERERLFVRWLEEIRPQCVALVLCGDVFDFWYEWRKVVPRGYVRVLAAIAGFTDAGIPVYYFSGNHDMWAQDYFVQETGVRLFHDPREFRIGGRRFFVGHGDGLGPNDRKFKMMKSLFKNRAARWFFSHLLHPDFAIRIADYFSRRSRTATGRSDNTYLGDDREWLYLFCTDTLRREHYDYFIFGHRHLALDKTLEDGSRYINLGDWLTYYTYGQWDGREFHLKTYPHDDGLH